MSDGVLFKGNIEEGSYNLIKTTDGWVLKGETSYAGFNEDTPTIEPKRGEWKFVGSSIEMIWECPFCGEHTFGFEEHLPNYCSNCGAQMKGADDE